MAEPISGERLAKIRAGAERVQAYPSYTVRQLADDARELLAELDRVTAERDSAQYAMRTHSCGDRADHAEDEIARPDFAWLRHVATWGRRRPGRGWHQSVTALIETLDATQAALDRVTDDSMAERLAQRCMSELSCWIDTREVDEPSTTYCVEHDVWAPDGECEHARRVADFVLDLIRAVAAGHRKGDS